jgi:hypothetical protein
MVWLEQIRLLKLCTVEGKDQPNQMNNLQGIVNKLPNVVRPALVSFVAFRQALYCFSSLLLDFPLLQHGDETLLVNTAR